MRVLITGGTGFLGRHCVERLLKEDCEIHAASRQPRSANFGRVHWYTADLRKPAEARQLVAMIRPSHILHLAWEATPRKYSASPENLLWLQASLELVAAFGEQGGWRFVGAGSSAEYGADDEKKCTEETPIRPATIYGKCKAACWLGVEAAAQHYGFSAAWGRIFLPYGPGDSAERLIPTVLTALERKLPVKTTHGRQLRDFIYATDVADLLIRLLLSTEAGPFNVGTGCGTTIRQVVEYLAESRGGRDLLHLGSLKAPTEEPLQLVADMSSVRERLRWKSEVSVEVGLARLLQAK